MNIFDKTHNPTAGVKLNLLLLHESVPLSVMMKDEESYNIQILRPVPSRYPWRRMIPTEYLRNSWTLVIDDDGPINAQGAQDTLVFLSSKD